MDLVELLTLYFKIISKYTDYFIKNYNFNNYDAYITGIYILEHVFKFGTLYKYNVIKLCEKCIYYYIEFILQLKQNDKTYIPLKNIDAFSFIFKKLFKTTKLNNNDLINVNLSNNIHNIILLVNIIIVYFIKYNKNIKLNITKIQIIIKKLSKLPSEYIILYYNINPVLIKNIKDTDIYIKTSIKLINHIKKIKIEDHNRIIKNINTIDITSNDFINQIQ